jgi:hypothetical protein
MTIYARSVLLRAIGAVTALLFWLGMVVLAISGFDSLVPDRERIDETLPFWGAALVILALVWIGLRFAGPGSGWGMVFIGILAPVFGFAVYRFLPGPGLIAIFWILVVAVVLAPIPGLDNEGAATVATGGEPTHT